MPISIAVGTVTATTAALTLTGRTGVQPEIQVATRPDFAWCVCPIFPVSAADAQSLPGLNQNTTYYVRARNILDGAGNRDAWSTIVSFRTSQSAAWASETANLRVDNAIIVPPEPILAFSPSGGASTVAGYPLENLARPAPVAARMLGSSNVFAFVAGVGRTPIDTIALLNTNLPEGAAVTITAGNDLATLSTSPAFTQAFAAFRASPNLPGRPGFHGLFRLSSPQTYDYWRIRTSVALPGNMLHAEHLILGLNRGTKAMAVEKKEGTVDLGTLERSRSGLIDRQAGFKLRRAEFDIAMLDENAFEQNYGDLWRDINEPLLVVPNSKSGPYLHDRILYGDFVGGGVTQNTSTRFSRSFIIESLI